MMRGFLGIRPQAPVSVFGFAIVGLGHGAEKFLQAIRGSSSVHVVALVSGDPDKAARLARKHSISHTYTYADFEAIRKNPHIQAVYLALPNAYHREFTERAAQAGKHILCEKPMAPTVEDCQAMIDACAHARVRLMIGYRCLFDPIYQQARQLIHQGVLGTLTRIESGFGYRAKSGWRVDPSLPGGGSLFDVGVYPTNTLNDLFPDPISITSAQVERISGVELSTRWEASLAQGVTVLCRSSYLEKIRDFFRVEGVHGTLTLQPAFSYRGVRLKAAYSDPISGKRVVIDVEQHSSAVSSFRLEAEHLADCACSGVAMRSAGAVGLRDIATIQQIYAAADGRAAS
jgi:predicted dehydrogenase